MLLEDPATERLVDLFQDSIVLRQFLRFLMADAEVADHLFAKAPKAKTQHILTNSRLDVLIHAERMAIVIECKVHDRASVNKLEKYHREWLRVHGFAPDIYWLVRKRTQNLGTNRYLKREVTWNELDLFLGRINDGTLLAETHQKVTEFRHHLRECGILLHEGENPVRTARSVGYDCAFAEALLKQIAGGFESVDAEVIVPGEVKHHRLFIGRQAWREKFQDGWVKRVVLRYKPIPGEPDHFTLSGAILFWNRSYVPDASYAISQFPSWAGICHSLGMYVRRNLGSKWPGQYGYRMEPPFSITRPVKYFGADCLILDEHLRILRKGDPASAIEEGCKVIRQHFSIVDQF